MVEGVKKRRVSHKGSKAKGADFEREIAAYLNDNVAGLNVRRALLSGGGRSEGGADLDDLPGIWAELKRTERLDLHGAMRQATIGLGKSKLDLMPTVITRRNQQATKDALVTMRLSDWLELYIRANQFVRLIPTNDNEETSDVQF